MKEIIVIVTCLCGIPKKDTRTLAELERESIQLERRIAWQDSVINEFNKKYPRTTKIDSINFYKLPLAKSVLDTVALKKGLIYLMLSK